jgi:hypothetical protein
MLWYILAFLSWSYSHITNRHVFDPFSAFAFLVAEATNASLLLLIPLLKF